VDARLAGERARQEAKAKTAAEARLTTTAVQPASGEPR